MRATAGIPDRGRHSPTEASETRSRTLDLSLGMSGGGTPFCYLFYF